MSFLIHLNKRAKTLAIITLVFMGVFVVRLFYLQIIQHDYYVGLANDEQVKRLVIPSKRGSIYALANGIPVPLVMNQKVYTVFADPEVVTEPEKIVDAIKTVAGGNARENLKQLVTKENSRYQILATKITRTQADKIKEYNLKGVGFQEDSQRVYIEGSLAAQTLGFVDYNGDGQYGVEGKLNNRLDGTDGLLQAVTDVNLVPLSISDKYINKPAKDGENIVLTIERNVQSYVEKALAAGVEKIGADRGSVVVMDPQNGKVLAIANTPSYDASKLNEVTDVSSFNNGVISTPYEPGSDVKTFTVATGVDKGVVDASATYVNTDYIEVEDRTITNATKGYTGEITFQTALNWSLNTGFVTIAQRLGDGKSINRQARDTMYDYFYNKFHLGKLTGIELANEATGIIISPEEVEGNAVRYSNMAFGQGMDVTMIQVATAFCSLVNGGKYYQPTIVAGTIDADGEYVEKDTGDYEQIISKSTADQVREMTHIARSSFFESIDKPGYYVGGKTGTSQVVKDGVYADDETVATYLGYGGSEKTSKYVIMVQVSGDHKEFGGAQDAMPIFTDISNWLLDYFKVTPKG